jgi:hypothetical protein
LYFRYESLAELRSLVQRHLAAHMIDLVAAAGGNPLKSADTTDQNPQRRALTQFLGEFDAFLRRMSMEWLAERDSEPHSTDDAKFLLRRAADEVVHFQSMITSDSLGISAKLADCLRRLKAVQRKQLYLDGGKSWREFWDEGDAIWIDLRVVSELLSQAAAGDARNLT